MKLFRLEHWDCRFKHNARHGPANGGICNDLTHRELFGFCGPVVSEELPAYKPGHHVCAVTQYQFQRWWQSWFDQFAFNSMLQGGWRIVRLLNVHPDTVLVGRTQYAVPLEALNSVRNMGTRSNWLYELFGPTHEKFDRRGDLVPHSSPIP